jgi:hypothetical protein
MVTWCKFVLAAAPVSAQLSRITTAIWFVAIGVGLLARTLAVEALLTALGLTLFIIALIGVGIISGLLEPRCKTKLLSREICADCFTKNSLVRNGDTAKCTNCDKTWRKSLPSIPTKGHNT